MILFLKNDTLHGPSIQRLKTSLTALGSVLSSIDLVVLLSFNTGDSFLASSSPLLQQACHGPLLGITLRHIYPYYSTFFLFLCVDYYILALPPLKFHLFLRNMRPTFKICVLHISKNVQRRFLHGRDISPDAKSLTDDFT